MTPLIAFCGLDCARCDARTATIHNDDALRQQVARQWSEWNHVDIPAASINCLGCRTEGIKCPYCDSMCHIRQCALQKGVSHCGECLDSTGCNLLQQVIAMPQKPKRTSKTPTSPSAPSDRKTTTPPNTSPAKPFGMSIAPVAKSISCCTVSVAAPSISPS